MIEHQTSKYNWDFSYIGANQDAILTAQEFGILSNKALTYNANAGSTRAAFSSYGAYANTVSVSDPSVTKCVGFTEEDKELVNQ